MPPSEKKLNRATLVVQAHKKRFSKRTSIIMYSGGSALALLIIGLVIHFVDEPSKVTVKPINSGVKIVKVTTGTVINNSQAAAITQYSNGTASIQTLPNPSTSNSTSAKPKPIVVDSGATK